MPPTSLLFLSNRFLSGPLESLFTLLIYILSKNLDASPLQLTILATLKPVTSLFSFVVCGSIINRPQHIRKYLAFNTLAGCAPCFAFPFVQSVWFYIGAYALFMVTMRAVYPAWMEVLNTTMVRSDVCKTVSRGTSLYYAINILFPPLAGYILDINEQIWTLLFVACGVLKALNLAVIYYVKPLDGTPAQTDLKLMPRVTLLASFRSAWSALKRRPNYISYQLLFFIGGAGIIGSQGILPIFFKEELHLTYTELAFAFSCCKGVMFVVTSPLWARGVRKMSIYRLNAYVDVFSCLFFAAIIASPLNNQWLWVGYLFYGTMQGGSEMSWNLSGPIFAGSDESTPYSSINLAAVGIRGCICPFLGQVLFSHTDAITVFTTAGILCFSGIIYGLWLDRRSAQILRTGLLPTAVN